MTSQILSAAPPAAPVKARAPWRRDILLGMPVVLFLLVLLIYPVGQLLWMSVSPADGVLTLDQYARLFHSSVYLDVLGITFKIAGWTTVLAVIGAYPVAYLTTIAKPGAKSSLLFWILLPFWTSFLVRMFSWIVLLGRNGVINQLLQSLGVTDAPASLLYNFGATLVGMVHAMMPLAILTMISVMENIDRNLPRAALTLGARPGAAFWLVYFPLSLPGVAAAAIMVFVTSLGFFITPALLGGRRETMITQLIIDQVQQTMNWGFAGAISMLLLVAVLLVFVAYDRLVGLSTLAGEASSAGERNRGSRGPLRRAGYQLLGALANATDLIGRLIPTRARSAEQNAGGGKLLWTVVVLVLLFLILPAFLMIPISFSSSSALDWPPRGVSMQWYQEMWDSPTWMSAAVRSLIVGLGTGVLSMLIGTPTAFLLVRSRMRFKAVFMAFVLLPIIVPRMIIAVGIFYFFSKVHLVGSAFGLMLGHTVVAIPYVVMTMMAVLKNYDTRLDQAAYSLGARPWATLRYVTFPIVGAGLLSSFLFAFVTSFDELTIALFVTGGLDATLPKQFWDEVILSVSPTIAAVSTCLFVFIALVIWAADRLRRRSAAH
ncbi:Putrescine transport system permease protein PotH [Pandoraea terrae]|uniref:Putrescine transport system permease protein PotH n=1 Tax=Pandoraea terrae TaxID=1537710 RepID=A0A5E4TVC4_9BURK|nr:ABC transporter permease subunit [Pandoraea terrae]VVD91182.1 Putrescine transport system permease protein PotH [Pandoraea terrae]